MNINTREPAEPGQVDIEKRGMDIVPYTPQDQVSIPKVFNCHALIQRRSGALL